MITPLAPVCIHPPSPSDSRLVLVPKSSSYPRVRPLQHLRSSLWTESIPAEIQNQSQTILGHPRHVAEQFSGAAAAKYSFPKLTILPRLPISIRHSSLFSLRTIVLRETPPMVQRLFHGPMTKDGNLKDPLLNEIDNQDARRVYMTSMHYHLP